MRERSSDADTLSDVVRAAAQIGGAEISAALLDMVAARAVDSALRIFIVDVLTNGGPLTELEWQVDRLWPILKAAAEIENRPGERR